MEFWRSPAYQAFFDYLESKGGFYYEVLDLLSVLVSLLSESISSDGEMRQCTVSPLHCLRKLSKFIYSRTLGIDTTHSSDALKANFIRRESAGVTLATVSIMPRTHV